MTAPVLALAKAPIAGPEVMGFLTAKARPPQDECLIWKAHAEVWSSLERALGAEGVKLEKLRPAPGFEIDGLVTRPNSSILIEIKASNSASDVYEGLGQLLLYRSMLKLPKACRLVL